jgi:hypothetical protein
MTNYSKHLTEEPQPQVRAKPHAANVEGVAQIGAATSFPKAPIFEGRALGPVGPTNNLVSGPGGGRRVYKAGGQHGLQTRQMPEGRDILSQFGPESEP